MMSEDDVMSNATAGSSKARTSGRKRRTEADRVASAERRAAEMDALHATLTEQVEALRESQQWRLWLDHVKAFHAYSLNNILLILAQREGATQVAGYRTWQQLGRQVRKGERGIRILATSTRAVHSDQAEHQAEHQAERRAGANGDQGERPEQGGAGERRERRFFPVSVFDVDQTEPIEGAPQVEHPAQPLTGEDVAGIYQLVATHLEGQGVPVRREPIAGRTNGYTAKQATQQHPEGTVHVVIDADLSPAQAAKTALHEAAHIALGHIEDDHAEYVAHRGRYEVEAESVAYVLAATLGLDTSAYSVGYVATWAAQAEADVLRETACRVLSECHTLAPVLEQLRHEQSESAA